MSTLNFNKLYSSSFEEKISNCIKTTKNPIVVIIGVIPYLDFGELSNYVLDKVTSTWNTKRWGITPSGLNGQYIWTDGANIYFSNSSTNSYYVLTE